MNDQNTTDQATVKADATPTKVYPTRSEAEADKPAEGKKRLYCVTRPDNSTVWLWADGYASAAHTVARNDGYTVSTGSKTVTREAVVAKLAEFTDEELKSLGLMRKKGTK